MSTFSLGWKSKARKDTLNLGWSKAASVRTPGVHGLGYKTVAKRPELKINVNEFYNLDEDDQIVFLLSIIYQAYYL